MFYNTALQNRLAGLKKNSKDIKVKDESSIFHLKGKYFFNIFCKIFEEEKTFLRNRNRSSVTGRRKTDCSLKIRTISSPLNIII